MLNKENCDNYLYKVQENLIIRNIAAAAERLHGNREAGVREGSGTDVALPARAHPLAARHMRARAFLFSARAHAGRGPAQLPEGQQTCESSIF